MRKPHVILWFLILFLSLLWSGPVSYARLAQGSYLRVFISKQAMGLYRDGKFVKGYLVSTSKYGVGNRQKSNQTPLGRHRIAKKIGAGAPAGAIFKNRVNSGKVAAINSSQAPSAEDFVTTRILWLEGLDPGANKGRRVDSFHRFIYIHGTPDEGLIGRPASHGCIRMKNKDVSELFNLVNVGTPVEILK